MSIIDIRGTNGSGKSSTVQMLLEKYPFKLLNEQENVDYSIPILSAVVMGRYFPLVRGCDCFSKNIEEQVVNRVRKYSKEYRHVILEGIVVAHTFQRFYDLSVEIGNYHFLFLSTPLRTCLGRVQSRRLRKGNTKPFDPKNVISDFHSIGRVREKCLAAGAKVVDLNWKNPLPQVLTLLGVV